MRYGEEPQRMSANRKNLLWRGADVGGQKFLLQEAFKINKYYLCRPGIVLKTSFFANILWKCCQYKLSFGIAVSTFYNVKLQSTWYRSFEIPSLREVIRVCVDKATALRTNSTHRVYSRDVERHKERGGTQILNGCVWVEVQNCTWVQFLYRKRFVSLWKWGTVLFCRWRGQPV